MTLAIDAPPLFPQAIPDSKSFHLYLLCVQAKGTNDVATIRQLDDAGCKDLSRDLSRDLERDVTTSSTGSVHDLRSPKSYPVARPEKRRRTTFDGNPSTSSVSLAYRVPETKRFNGVRYRHDRKTWTAEMKPPKYKNKVFFGEFKCQTLAARVVDAAFYYYSKPHLLNFRDSPQILSSSPTASGGLLGEEEKLGFVKEQAKWLASIASSLPSSINPNLPSEIGLQDALQGFVQSPPTGIPAKLSSSSKLSSTKLSSSKLPPKLSPYFSTSSLASHAHAL